MTQKNKPEKDIPKKDPAQETETVADEAVNEEGSCGEQHAQEELQVLRHADMLDQQLRHFGPLPF